MASSRRHIHFNPAAATWTAPKSPDYDLVKSFHNNLPGYKPSKLVPLDDLAKELGVKSVVIKDESDRVGLPAYKILGASWGTFRAVARQLGLPPDIGFEDVKKAALGKPIKLFATTEGNHGRAVARMGALLDLPVEILVPRNMVQPTIDNIASEGAEVIVSRGNYEDAIAEVYEKSKATEGGILVQDTAFEGYEDIPNWIVEGYTTMLREVDQQLDGKEPDLVISPVGAGVLAQAVVTHFKQPGRKSKVACVEADTSACLWKSLEAGKRLIIETTPTVMAGLDCGAVSTVAWPLLQAGVDASVTVSDYESHKAAQQLQTSGINAGPCGASSVVALRRLVESGKDKLGLTSESTVVMFSTEAGRDYETPLDVAVEDPVSLTQTLVQIDSSSPDLGSVPGPGETMVARYIKGWLEHRNIESHWIEPTKGRPSVVGVVRGSGGGKSLMLNGHIDTVTLQGYDDDPLSGEIKDGKLYGRGSADMKCGVAANMVALLRAKNLGLRGDVIFAGVADEEAASIGTEDVLKAGWWADGVVVTEPTNLEIVHAHKGFVWVEVDILGKAAHGSMPGLGVDAICRAGSFLVELEKYAKQLAESAGDPVLGQGSVHASLIKGGEETSSYPALCTVTLERRTVAGETPESVQQEIHGLLEQVAVKYTDFKYDLRVPFFRSPFSIAKDDPFALLVGSYVGKHTGSGPKFVGGPFWTDCALLADAGIKGLIWGPLGAGLHSKEEWVDVKSIETVADTLTAIAKDYCS